MKKIMFNDKYGLTQAVLEGRKTMTRRSVPKRYDVEWDEDNKILFVNTDYGRRPNGWVDIREVLGYRVGEVVAIAQSYKDCGNFPDYQLDEDGYPIMPKNSGYFNKMFVRADLMPHHIRITDIKMERLQDISDDDCIAEGIICKWHAPACRNYYYVPNETINHPDKVHETPQEAFAALIDKVSGKGTWESNPWVFAYEFELVD